MSDKNSVFERTFKINTYDVDMNQRLSLYSLLGFLQDMASEHALQLGFGYEDMQRMGVFWVLLRQKVQMRRWPRWRDSVRISTWTCPVQGLSAIREFEIFVGDAKVGQCSTTWMILDAQSRRPRRMVELLQSFHARHDYSIAMDAPKISLPQEMPDVSHNKVKISDVDMNKHTNNLRYTQWCVDSLAADFYSQCNVAVFEINFLLESFLGEDVLCYHVVQEADGNVFFKGVKEADGKLVFMARWGVGS